MLSCIRFARETNLIVMIDEELKEALGVLEKRKTELYQDPTVHTIQEHVVSIGRKVKKFEQIKEKDLCQRSRAYWLKLGDHNTIFFANMIKERKNSNSIYRLRKEDGKPMITRKDMEEKCMRFFGELFQEDEGRGETVDIRFTNKVNEEENRDLMRTPTVEEIKGVIDNLHLDESPGLDGFNGVFSQDFLVCDRE